MDTNLSISMNFGTLVSYRLNRLPAPERCRIYREFHGWRDKSQYSKYTYDRKGLLNDIPHVLINRCVLITKKQDARKIIFFLKENKADVFVRDIILTKSDLEVLSK